MNRWYTMFVRWSTCGRSMAPQHFCVTLNSYFARGIL